MLVKNLQKNTPLASTLLFLVFVGIRLFHLFNTADDPFVNVRFGDEAHYHQWAEEISKGSLFKSRSFFTSPLYAYFLGGLYFFGLESIMPLRIINMLLVAFSFWLLLFSSRIVSEKNYSLIPPALFTFCSPVLFYESFMEKTTLVIFLTSLAIYLFLSFLKEKKWNVLIIFSVISGLLALAHPLMLILFPICSLFLLFSFKDNLRKKAGFFSTYFIAYTIVIISATLHNYIVEKDFVLICSNGGQNFYTGNHTGNKLGLYVSPTFSIANLKFEEENYKKEAEKRLGRHLKSSEVSTYWYKEALKEMLTMPNLSLKKITNRIRWTVGEEELDDTRSFGFYKDRWLTMKIPMLGFGAISFLGIIGLVIGKKDRNILFLSTFILVYIGAISMYFVYGRYRLPLIIPMSLLAPIGIQEFVRCFHENKKKIRVIILLFPILYGLIFVKVVHFPESWFADYYNMGNKFTLINNIEQARIHYENAILIKPGDHPAADKVFLRLVNRYYKEGNKKKADQLTKQFFSKNPSKKNLFFEITNSSSHRD